MEMSPNDARNFWKALMTNAVLLINDAHLLLDANSFGRARSLTVLAQEELGKALWIYNTFSAAWNTGDTKPRTVTALQLHTRDHKKKYYEAFVYGNELAMFWGDWEEFRTRLKDGETWEEMAERLLREAEAAANQANLDKQRGFYVDRQGDGKLLAPHDIAEGIIADDLELAAQVVEMLLIQDHSRMKHDATTPYDSTHSIQFALLPISHPTEWAEVVERQSGEEE